MVNAPAAFVVTSRDRFVWVCVAVTVAPGTTPPDVSVTFPTRVPYTFCANAQGAAATVHSSASRAARVTIFLIDFLLGAVNGVRSATIYLCGTKRTRLGSELHFC